MEISTLPSCVSGMRSKYTRKPPVSTMATAIAHLFWRASAMAAAATFLALSAEALFFLLKSLFKSLLETLFAVCWVAITAPS